MIQVCRTPVQTLGLSASLLSLCTLGACQPTVKTADEFHRVGIVAIQKNDLTTALDNLDQAVALESSNPTMLVNRGLVHDELGKYEAAIADYTAAIALDETLSEAYYNRANAHHNLQQFEDAVADYSKAIEHNADFAHAYVNRAISWEAIGEEARAIADLTRAVDIFKQNGDTEDVERVIEKIETLRLFKPSPQAPEP